jgi:hypothetical protein
MTTCSNWFLFFGIFRSKRHKHIWLPLVRSALTLTHPAIEGLLWFILCCLRYRFAPRQWEAAVISKRRCALLNRLDNKLDTSSLWRQRQISIISHDGSGLFHKVTTQNTRGLKLLRSVRLTDHLHLTVKPRMSGVSTPGPPEPTRIVVLLSHNHSRNRPNLCSWWSATKQTNLPHAFPYLSVCKYDYITHC